MEEREEKLWEFDRAAFSIVLTCLENKFLAALLNSHNFVEHLVYWVHNIDFNRSASACILFTEERNASSVFSSFLLSYLLLKNVRLCIFCLTVLKYCAYLGFKKLFFEAYLNWIWIKYLFCYKNNVICKMYSYAPGLAESEYGWHGWCMSPGQWDHQMPEQWWCATLASSRPARSTQWQLEQSLV